MVSADVQQSTMITMVRSNTARQHCDNRRAHRALLRLAHLEECSTSLTTAVASMPAHLVVVSHVCMYVSELMSNRSVREGEMKSQHHKDKGWFSTTYIHAVPDNTHCKKCGSALRRNA